MPEKLQKKELLQSEKVKENPMLCSRRKVELLLTQYNQTKIHGDRLIIKIFVSTKEFDSLPDRWIDQI